MKPRSRLTEKEMDEMCDRVLEQMASDDISVSYLILGVPKTERDRRIMREYNELKALVGEEGIT